MTSLPKNFLPLLTFLNIIFLQILITYSSLENPALKGKVSAVFVFGDSTVDPGNNDYFPTYARSNFPPYGKDFINHQPTGRFSNGRLVTDFIAEYLGVKYTVPPYLDPSLTLEDLMTGVAFASSGAGYDPLTCQIGGAYNMMQQLVYFREYKAKLSLAIGEERVQDLISKAEFIVSTGTNDYSFNYYGPVSKRNQIYPTLASYNQFLMGQANQFLQGLLDEGARKVGVVSIPPIGCLPAIITTNSTHPIFQRQCVGWFNEVARESNAVYAKVVKRLQKPGVPIVFTDIYNPILDMVNNPSKYGFDEVHKGCCGTGLLEADFLCNPTSYVCPDVSTHLFWDAFHPSERGYLMIFNAITPIIAKYLV